MFLFSSTYSGDGGGGGDEGKDFVLVERCEMTKKVGQVGMNKK